MYGESADDGGFALSGLQGLRDNPDTIVRSSGSWSDDGFEPGRVIDVQGSASNDGIYRIDPQPAPRRYWCPIAALMIAGAVNGGIALKPKACRRISPGRSRN